MKSVITVVDPDEKAGYDSFLNKWVETGEEPCVFDCPSIYMEASPERTSFILGWNRARKEFGKTK